MLCIQAIKVIILSKELVNETILVTVYWKLNLKENVFTESFPRLESLFSTVRSWSLGLGFKDQFICFAGDTVLNSLHSLTEIQFSIMVRIEMY